jgi:hypothetical protein
LFEKIRVVEGQDSEPRLDAGRSVTLSDLAENARQANRETGCDVS